MESNRTETMSLPPSFRQRRAGLSLGLGMVVGASPLLVLAQEQPEVEQPVQAAESSSDNVGQSIEGPPKEWMRLGAFGLRPRASSSLVYNDNINISRDKAQSDLIWTITGGISAIAGEVDDPYSKSVVIDYSPSYKLFTEHGENNSLDHDARFKALLPFAKLTLGANQTFQKFSIDVLDIGGRVSYIIIGTILTAKYELSEKTALEVNGRQTLVDYQNYLNSKEWSNDNWFNYQLNSRWTVGGGVTFGLLEVGDNRNGANITQTYQQALVRTRYQLSQKIDLRASVGGELRQFESDQGNKLEPIFSLGGSYSPQETTILSLEARRQIQNSAFSFGDNYTATGISATLQQQFLQRYVISWSGGFDHLGYQSTTRSTFNANRSDEYFFTRLALETTINRQWNAGIFYGYRQRISSLETVDFSNNQIGLQTAFRF